MFDIKYYKKYLDTLFACKFGSFYNPIPLFWLDTKIPKILKIADYDRT